MTIENIKNLIGAKLINTPKIKKVESATTYLSKIELGDIFFALDKSLIDKAIENGAYAIVYEAELDIKDKEIAYLKVDSIKEAANRLLRYIISKKDARVYYFKNIEKTLLKQISTKKSSLYTFIPSNFQKAFELILNSKYQIFITTNKEEAKILSSNYKELIDMVEGYIIKDSLLKTTFKIEKFVYQNMHLPPFFFDNLKKVTKFCRDFEIAIDIAKIRYSQDFKPYFIDNNLNILNNSQKVVIFIKELETITKALNYLKEYSKWTKTIILTPPKTKLLSTNIKPIWVNDNNEAKEILKKEHFNYAFCYGLAQETILENITSYNLFT